jgi:RNA polymerase sigma factor (sigma-70 family)
MDEYERDHLADLTAAARKGDLAAYGRLVEHTRASVESVARRILHHPADAEDVAQEAYLHAYHKLGELHDTGAVLAWLQRIARNMALNRRRGHNWASASDIDLAQIAAPEPEADEDRASLARAVVGLATQDRRLCERYYHGGWTTTRLAADLGISEMAVRKRLQRIRQRLKQGMTMNTSELPQRIIELLSKPNLTAIPENPVGAIWEEFQQAYADFTCVDLPEEIDADAVRRILGDASDSAVEDYLADAARQQWLRRELTVPMLLAAAPSEAPQRLITTGKAYRVGDEESQTRLHAFHQAEVLWIDEGLSEWRIMEPFAAFIEVLNVDARLRIEPAAFSLYCERGWQISAQWQGHDWQTVAGWGRMKPGVVERLGYDPARVRAVGLGLGLERLAMLRYGIDDIRMIEAERV